LRYKPSAEHVEKKSDFSAASLRLIVLVTLFSIFTLVIAILYILYIVLMFVYVYNTTALVNYLIIFDCFLAVALLVVGVSGLLSSTTCLLPKVRFWLSIIYLIIFVVVWFMILILRVVVPFSTNMAVGNVTANMITSIIALILLCFVGIPCMVCACFQPFISWGIIKEDQSKEPATWLALIAKVYLKLFFVFDLIKNHIKQKKEAKNQGTTTTSA